MTVNPINIDRKLMKPAVKKDITNSEIIELYKEGWSQKDIATMYRVAVLRTRSVLKNAGYSTSGFRALNPEARKVIISLIKYGIEYVRIEKILDISFHAVREIVEKDGLQGISKQARKDKLYKQVPSCRKNKMLVTEYMAGESFVNLCVLHHLKEKEIISFFLDVTEDAILVHRESFKELLLTELELGDHPSVISISNKFNVSVSIIKKYFES